MNRRRLAVSVTLVLVLAAVAALVWWAGWPAGPAVQETVERAGVWGPVAFVLMYAVLSLVPVPLGLVTVLAGTVFGFTDGLLLVWAGSVLGAVAGWLVARTALLPVVEDLVARHDGGAWAHLSGTGVWPVVVVRMLPVAPFMAVNYVAGASGVPFRPYLVGTVVGILPSSALYVQVGAAGLEDPAALSWALFGIVVLVVLGGYLLRRRAGRSTPERA